MGHRHYRVEPSEPPQWWWRLMAAVGLMWLVLLLVGCGSTEVVTEYRDRIEYRDALVYQRDTIIVTDSVFATSRADTVWLTRWRTEYREKVRTDSVVHIVVDSVAVEVPVYIERQQSAWSKLKENMGLAFIFILIALALWALMKIKKAIL